MNVEEVLNYCPNVNISNEESETHSNHKRKRIDSNVELSLQDIDEIISRTNENISEIDEHSLKRLISQLERKISKNQEMRIKFNDNPSKFMDSEIELYEVIKEMHNVSTQPALYQILIESQIIQKLIGLLSHENSDIACAIVALIQELTDIAENDELAKTRQLMETFLKNQIILLLVNNLERLDENVKEESEGIHNTLAIIENLTEFSMDFSGDLRPLIQWLLRKLKSKPIFYPNKLYAAEILSILMQGNPQCLNIVGSLNGIDILLHLVSYYKRHEPSTADEEEFIHNLFNCLCSSLFECDQNRELFYKAEGIELMILILKEKRSKESTSDVRTCALRLLYYCFNVMKSDDLLRSMCDKLIQVLGLRVLMPIFLKPTLILSHKVKRKQSSIEQVEEHTITILLTLIRYCSDENKLRILNKFTEQNGVKTERLVELHLKYYENVKQSNEKLQSMNEKDEIVGQYFRSESGKLITLEAIDQL
ncbi:beta-catenin-like protein 1-like protein [Sarcoptes scabiei]|uniref:Beta-catenin-like protein 1 n=1 Tax=Sarcoptes scabiei TaxID=52283 RepID=A0A132A1L9_SARSC|nr:beta-catenin-like protein 1-like protein [Sarcoptes scabiei]